jgi:hypothetical protein
MERDVQDAAKDEIAEKYSRERHGQYDDKQDEERNGNIIIRFEALALLGKVLDQRGIQPKIDKNVQVSDQQQQ